VCCGRNELVTGCWEGEAPAEPLLSANERPHDDKQLVQLRGTARNRVARQEPRPPETPQITYSPLLIPLILSALPTYLYDPARRGRITSVSSNRYQFRNVAEGVHFATASDRYAGWLGQIYSEDKGYKITRTQKIIKGTSIAEEKLPVRSVVEYFEHYTAIELDFTFYAFLLDGDGNPTRNHAPLVEYAKWLPADAKVILKVPEAITASRRWMTDGKKRNMADNPDYLDPVRFTDRFYRPAIEVLGDRIIAFIFEKGYQRKDSCRPPEDNITHLRAFFERIPRDWRYHIEERTDRLKTPDYFAFLHEWSIGNVFSHWTWLPDLRTQWDQAGGFTGAWSITRLLTPLRVAYEETYARYHPFAELKDEFPQMYRDAAFIIDQGLKAGVPTVTVANNRAGGNANEINQRVLNELRLLEQS